MNTNPMNCDTIRYSLIILSFIVNIQVNDVL